MDEFIKLLDPNLQYVQHKLIENTFYIDVVSTVTEIECPFCGESSSRIHSHYARSFQDLPIQGKKVEITLNNRKVFCDNPNCNHRTFAERFNWLAHKSKKTSRLDEEIIRLSLNCSSMAASRILRTSTATISKSTVCTLLKKNRNNHQ